MVIKDLLQKSSLMLFMASEMFSSTQFHLPFFTLIIWDELNPPINILTESSQKKYISIYST